MRIFAGSGIARYSAMAEMVKELDEKGIEAYNPKSQRAVDVLHYTIKINLKPEQRSIDGDVIISLLILDRTAPRIDLNFYDNLEIKRIELNGSPVKYERQEKILSVIKPDIKTDSADIRILYSGRPQNLGFGSFQFGENDNKPYVYTLSEPVYASTWFPCIDLPDDKALADLYITNDSSDVSVSNGKLIGISTEKKKRTYHWRTLYPISTYLIALYSANYKSYSFRYLSASGDSLDISYYALPNDFEEARRDFSDHPKYLKVFEDLFGPYPFVKEKYSVAEFWWESGAMENQTMTGIGSRFITGKKFFSDMLIHELAHHWWGDAVGLKTWKDIWLNEGFASYSEALYWEKTANFAALQSTLRSKFGTFDRGTLYNPGDYLFGSLVYDKGAWVLHMLRKEVGDKVFFRILKEYFRLYCYSNASTSDFKTLCEKISGRNLTGFFNQWIYKGEGIIDLKYSWSTESAGEYYSTKVKIKQLQKGYDIYKFKIDIKIIYENNDSTFTTIFVDEKEKEITLTSKRKPVKIELDPDNWLLAKIEPQ
jgi:aminopeptidase N